jgi:hypothetical protein
MEWASTKVTEINQCDTKKSEVFTTWFSEKEEFTTFIKPEIAVVLRKNGCNQIIISVEVS